MPDPLSDHVPSEAVRRVAEREGIDLEALRRDDPTAYMMANAGEAVRASAELAEIAGPLLLTAFPRRLTFRSQAGALVRFSLFPPPDAADLARLDALLEPLLERPEWRARHAFYRIVEDRSGLRRELALPLAPQAYEGGDAVVGPFRAEGAADAWAARSVTPPRVHDAFGSGSVWFCDVFRGDQS